MVNMITDSNLISKRPRYYIINSFNRREKVFNVIKVGFVAK